ncbi:Exopolyphosphatase [Microbotryomycetes sp. JL201]|nr:Exopolyphosphatase [Microbotryomycetes sp. JL201]
MASGRQDELATFLERSKRDFMQDLNAGHPLVNWTTARSDLALRPENEFALSNAQIDAEKHLLCLDDLPNGTLPQLGAVRLALVDHNAMLSSVFGPDDTRVTAVIDHHADEGRHMHASPRLIQIPTGSCTSLVATYFLPLLPATAHMSSSLADLLLSAILIDTNLKPSTAGGKATDTDLRAVRLLSPFSSFVDGAEGSAAAVGGDVTATLLQVGRLLQAKKSDVAWMSGRDLLRRDYKEYQHDAQSLKYGLATVPVSFRSWIDKDDKRYGWEGVERDCRAWMEERHLDFLGVLTSFEEVAPAGKNKGARARELYLHVGGNDSTSERLRNILYPGLEADADLRLGPWFGGDLSGEPGFDKRWRLWQQVNAKATRKQVAPAIKHLLDTA